MTVVLAALLVSGVCLGLSLGSVSVPVVQVIEILRRGPRWQDANPTTPEDTWSIIVWSLRFPRVLLAFIEGASLGVAGSVMQGLFRNPMADPYVLGVSSGGSLGAVIAIVTGMGRALGIWSIPAISFLGAMGSIVVVYTLATFRGRTDTWTLLLSGIAVSSLVSSIIAFLMVMARERVDEIVFWTMGALSRATWKAVGVALIYSVPGVALLWLNARGLDAMSFGEESAFHLGVDVERTKKVSLWTTALITAGSVAFTGPIGFIGLIVPHAIRLVAGPDHRWLLPLSALTGGTALILADLLARTIVRPFELPVGVITALFGAPFFLYLLFKKRRERH